MKGVPGHSAGHFFFRSSLKLILSKQPKTESGKPTVRNNKTFGRLHLYKRLLSLVQTQAFTCTSISLRT